MELEKLLDRVSDEESFLRFVRALQADRQDEVEKKMRNPSSSYSSGANGWENGSIESFLDAAIAWAEDSNFGDSQNLSGASVWKKVATFLYCGKTYE
ncbi:MAG: hypothetical protein CVV11_05005 [Gammaproteobacteria bacterium HGW-Gammaproteobacteria-15]|nr:MAG: hypothetical protein CVV11_05005 [Gammaproteobacteria bacterium HGW-Gammaproteobacteria-15]